MMRRDKQHGESHAEKFRQKLLRPCAEDKHENRKNQDWKITLHGG